MKTLLCCVATLALLPAARVTGRTSQPTDSPAQAEQEFGDAWADLGNWKRAIRHYRKALALAPDLDHARLRLAQGLAATGSAQAAQTQLAKFDPNRADPETACLAGQIWLALGKPTEACAAFDRALTIQADHGSALVGAGLCRQARFERSADPADQATARERLSDYLARLPQGPQADQAREALRQLQLGKTGVLLSEARQALAEGRAAQAEQLLRPVLEQQPGLAEAHYLLGMALASPELDRLEAARAQWCLAGEHPSAVLQLGILDLEADNLEQAHKLLQHAVDLDPGLAEAHYQLGLVHQELQALAEQDAEEHRRLAGACFARVIELSPGGALADRAASKSLALSGELRYLAAGEVIDGASELEIGRRLSDRLEHDFGLLRNRPQLERLNRILRRIVDQSDRLPAARPPRIQILRVDGINALSLTGGTIYLYQGLVDYVARELADSDDVFAAIIGHELVHLDRRHGLDLVDLVNGSQPLLQAKSLNVRSLGQMMKGFERKHEFEADLVGALYAYRAGYDPSAAYRFHRRMIATGHEVPEGLDHPTHAGRALRLKEYLLGLRSRARQFDLGLRELERGNYDLAIRHLEIFLGLFPASQAGQNNLAVALHRRALQIGHRPHSYKLSTDLDPDRRIPPIRLRGQADTRAFAPDRTMMIEALDLFRSISLRDPSYLPALTNLGASLLALGRQGEAAAVLGQVLEAEPDSPSARIDLAVVGLVTGQTQPAIERLERLLAERPEIADAHYNLARAFHKAGRAADARRHYQAYLERDPDSGWARQAQAHLTELDAATAAPSQTGP